MSPERASSADEVDRDRDWRAVRHSLGLTRRELAAELHTSKSSIRRWEVGQQSPSIAYQRQMLALLDGGEA